MTFGAIFSRPAAFDPYMYIVYEQLDLGFSKNSKVSSREVQMVLEKKFQSFNFILILFT